MSAPKPRRWLARLWWAVLGIVAALVAGVVAARGEYRVPPTVTDDAKLPAIVVDGVRLRSEAFGDERLPTALVLHGGPGNSYEMLRPLAELKGRHVVFYDQRGSGLSERVPDERLTVDQLISEALGVARLHAHDEPVDLIGHSWGAMLAVAIAGAHPERVRSLTLIEPGFLTPALGDQFLARTNRMMPPWSFHNVVELLGVVFRAPWVQASDAHARRDFVMLNLANANFENHPVGSYFCRRDGRSGAIPEVRLGQAVSAALLGPAVRDGHVTFDLSAAARSYPGPVLLVASECNSIIGVDVQREHQLLFQKASLELVRGAGHFLVTEKTEESLALIERFLKAQP